MIDGQLRLVPVLQHGRQGERREQDDRGADDAGGGGQHGADDRHRQCESARYAAHQHLQRAEEFVGDAALVEHESHEDEHRYGYQPVTAHHAEDPVHREMQIAEIRVDPDVEIGVQDLAGYREDHRHAAEDEGQRIAREEQGDERREHQHDEEKVRVELGHRRTSGRR
jgi:hypothetical protein